MRWKWFLQRALGGLRRVPNASARLIDARGTGHEHCHLGLTDDCVRALLAGEAPVVVCRGAVPAAVCSLAAERLDALLGAGEARPPGAGHRAATGFEKWYLGADPDSPASDYTKVGYTKTDVFREEGVRMAAGRAAPKRYLHSAELTRRLLDEHVFALGRNPLKHIEQEWSALPSVASFRVERCPVSHQPFLPCAVRRMLPGGRKPRGNIHMDVVVPGRTVSLNIYLRVPEAGAGGELVMYPVEKGPLSRVLNAHFFETLEIQNFYPQHTFYPEQLLTSGAIEPIVYRPEVGDVVIIDPAFPHAVHDFQGDPDRSRLSLQTFVQVSKKGAAPGALWEFEYAV